MNEMLLFGGLILVWCLTGLYLSIHYQRLVKKVSYFREEIKSHVLENGTTDEKLYQYVIDESRKILPDNHDAVKAHKNSK
jgi:hypothetical protein